MKNLILSKRKGKTVAQPEILSVWKPNLQLLLLCLFVGDREQFNYLCISLQRLELVFMTLMAGISWWRWGATSSWTAVWRAGTGFIIVWQCSGTWMERLLTGWVRQGLAREFRYKITKLLIQISKTEYFKLLQLNYLLKFFHQIWENFCYL